MMKHPVVSIIIPSYNYADFIAETITCLQQQKYPNWEAIIVDDGSIDDTREVVQGFIADKRIVYLYQENKGLPAARNAGIKIAKGKYIQFLDADDLISEDKLLNQVGFMEGNHQVDISYTNSYYFKDGDQQQLFLDMKLGDKEWMPKFNAEGQTILRQLIKKNIMPVNAALIKKEVFFKVGLQNETLKSFEDWEFWIRCAIANQFFGHLQDKNAFALIRVHHNSMSQNRMKMSENEIVLRETIENLLTDSLLPVAQKTVLIKINNRKKQDSYRFYIIKDSFFDWNKWKLIYKKIGFKALLRIYFKALNDVRKENLHKKRSV